MASRKASTKGGSTKRARPQRLPEMADAGITELDQLALEYVEVRDPRIALSKREGEIKKMLIAAMHKHKREEYVYEGTKIVLVPGEEKVKVKVANGDIELDEEE